MTKPLPKVPDQQGAVPAKAPGTRPRRPAPAVPGRVATGGPAATPQDVLAAQSTAGNAAVVQSLGGGQQAATPATVALPARIAAALATFADHDPKEVKKVAGEWLEAKAGDPKNEVARDAGPLGEVMTKGEAAAGAGVGVYGGASAGKVDLGALGTAYEVLAEGGLVVGGELRLSGAVKKELGPVALAAEASFKAFGGAYVRGQASAYLISGDEWWQKGGAVSASGEAFAGGKAKGDAGVSIEGKSLALDLGVEGEVMAGAQAQAEGSLALDLASKRIEIGGQVSAFAGVKASGAVRGKAKLYGREALSGKLGASAKAGVGGSANFGFKLKAGVLKVDLGGGGTLGVGGDLDTEVGADFKPIAVLVWRKVSRALDNLNPVDISKASRLTDPGSKLRRDLIAYREKKLLYLQSGRATEYVKIEKIQAYVDWHINRTKLKKRKDTSLDPAIKALVEDTFRSPDGAVTVRTKVSCGKLEELKVSPENAVEKLKTGQVDGNDYSAAPVVGDKNKNLRTAGQL